MPDRASHRPPRRSTRRSSRFAAAIVWTALAVAVPTLAGAQYRAPSLTNPAIGERYHVELAGTLWNPTVTGLVSSAQLGKAGSDLDFVTDLGFQQTRFKDLRVVLRPGRKHRFRFQYTPIDYTSEVTLSRDVTFNGQKFSVNLPVNAEFGWKVMRFGYEYDFVYQDRGFVGVLLEGRYTQLAANLASPIDSEVTTARAVLPALGLVGRGYVAKDVALNFEVSGFNVPGTVLQKATTKCTTSACQANYYDWDISGTVNFTNNVGLEIGWRRLTTFLDIDQDKADFKFQGLWFGGVVRY
jgi:hypothetical protein